MSNIIRDKSQGTYTVKTRGGDRTIWYDRALRLWTLQTNDKDGNQLYSVEYTAINDEAFAWLTKEETVKKFTDEEIAAIIASDGYIRMAGILEGSSEVVMALALEVQALRSKEVKA